jgi:hypothetical protein
MPLLAVLIPALVDSGIKIFAAVRQANALNAKGTITQADWDALDSACQSALDASAIKQALIEAKRAAALGQS